MPSGGYGPGIEDDAKLIREALNDETVRRFGLQNEWLSAYVAARIAGAEPRAAASAAYMEWDL